MSIAKNISSISVRVVQNSDRSLNFGEPKIMSTNILTVGPIAPSFDGQNDGVFNRLDELLDVVEPANVPSGAVGVYNSENAKYEIKKLDFDDLVGDIDDVDGGTF